jgi:hypothetical protein
LSEAVFSGLTGLAGFRDAMKRKQKKGQRFKAGIRILINPENPENPASDKRNPVKSDSVS